MTKRNMTKKVAKFVVGTSVGYTVASALANNTTVDKPHQKAEAMIGVFVVGSIAGELTEDWTDRKVDELFDAIEAFKKAD